MSTSQTNGIHGKALDVAGYLQNGFHAMQTIPSQHRLLNATGMIAFWVLGRRLANIAVGETPEGKEVKLEDVPAPLQFMHGVWKYNKYSDEPKDQWMKVCDQLFPAIFGAFGAILGSLVAFLNNNKDQRYKTFMKDKSSLSLLEADEAASYAQAIPLRVLAGVFAVFSSASGLTPLYGLFLNPAFNAAANRKMFAGAENLTGWKIFGKPTNTQGKTPFAPSNAASNILDDLEAHFKAHGFEGKSMDEIADELIKSVIIPLFPKKSPEEMRKMATRFLDEQYDHFSSQNLTVQDISKKATAVVKSLFSGTNLEVTLKKHFGFTNTDIHNASIGNMGWFGALSNKLGAGKNVSKIAEKLKQHDIPNDYSPARV